MESDRQQLLNHLRPNIIAQIFEIETETDLHIRFMNLPISSEVLATYTFDPHSQIPTIAIRNNAKDVDIAHELMHMRLELIESYNVLAWRSSSGQTAEHKAIMRTIRTFVDDEVVHARLFTAGFLLDGEVIRPQLFNDRCINIIRNLRNSKTLKNDGMAHQDKYGCGDLYRAMLLVQCYLIRMNYHDILAKERLILMDDFVDTFRQFRPNQFEKAQRILSIFRSYDVHSVHGHAEILSKLAIMEEVNQFMGVSTYQKVDGKYILPFPF